MKKIYILFTICALFSMVSCHKEFLEKRPDKALLVPQTLNDFQNLMDDYRTMNAAPGLHIIASDDRFVLDDSFASMAGIEQNAYLWAKEVNTGVDWTALYKQVFNCNIVLDGLHAISPTSNQLNDYNLIKGSALFFRAYAFYQLADIFAMGYDETTAENTPGIILRLKSDVNDRPGRASLAQSFRQITEDLLLATELLPSTSSLKTRPNAPAALGLLARVYLTMEKYELAFDHANKSLMVYNKLLNYNSLNLSNTANTFPVVLPYGNDEVLFSTGHLNNYFMITTSVLGYIDPLLFPSYHSNDLRKVMYYRDRGNGAATFKASYNGTMPLSAGNYKNFSGVAVDEVYLIRAECHARLNRPAEAMEDLNTLLVTRWKTGTFVPYKATGGEDALRQVLAERRKELFSRGLRWADLKRLNKDPRFAMTLSRIVNGQNYTLAPNSPRYAFPIPDDELSSNVQQNER